MKRTAADFKNYALAAKILLAAAVICLERMIASFLWAFAWAGTFLCIWISGYASRESSLIFWSGLAIAFFIGLRRFSLPSRENAIARLELNNNLKHRPLRGLEDKIVTGEPHLWFHEKNAQKKLLGRIRLPRPFFDLARRDPYALRLLFILIMFLAIFKSPDTWKENIAKGLFPTVNRTAAIEEHRNFIEARITFPPYTAQKTLILNGAAKIFDVPEGSKLHLELQQKWGKPVLAFGDRKYPLVRGKDSDIWTIDADITDTKAIKVTSYGVPVFTQKINWIKDQPPVLSWNGDVAETPGGELKIPLKIEDDYGIKKLTLRGILAPGQPPSLFGKPLALDKKITLATRGSAQQINPVFDATGHVWAGRKLSIMVEAEDFAGNISSTTPVDTVLPVRRFRNPLAMQIASIRDDLLGFQGTAQNTVSSIEAILFRPDLYAWDNIMTLGLRSAASRLYYAPSMVSVEESASILWQLATRMEDGGISESQISLKEAVDKLQQAVQSGADKAEIARLMQEMQQALASHLQQMARQLMKASPQTGSPPSSSASLSGLDKFMRQLQDELLSKDPKSASEKLNQLQQLADMLGSSAMQVIPKDVQQMMKDAQEIQRIISRQKKLTDRTRSDKENTEKLEDEQKDIHSSATSVSGQSDETSAILKSASGEMALSAEQLRDGNRGRSVGHQEEALKILQQGNQALQQKLKERMQNMISISIGSSGSQDPLGRSIDSGETEIPANGGTRKVDEIIKILRDREGDMTRPSEERNYYQRLLRQW